MSNKIKHWDHKTRISIECQKSTLLNVKNRCHWMSRISNMEVENWCQKSVSKIGDICVRISDISVQISLTSF